MKESARKISTKRNSLKYKKAVLAGTITQTEADKTLAGWKKIIMGILKRKTLPKTTMQP